MGFEDFGDEGLWASGIQGFRLQGAGKPLPRKPEKIPLLAMS